MRRGKMNEQVSDNQITRQPVKAESKHGCYQILFTIAEASAALRRCRSALYADISRGLIKPVYLGKSIRIHRSELERIACEGLK
jgi:helix-turn-helix protein